MKFSEDKGTRVQLNEYDKKKIIVKLNTEPGKTYQLETSTNLKDWKISGEYGSIEESLQFQLPVSRDKQRVFFRFKTE